MRGRDSELAGGGIISKDKAPPASAKALAPPPEAEGEMIGERRGEMIDEREGEMIGERRGEMIGENGGD